MPNKFNDEILREFDEIITKYQIDESYFDLVDGYIPLEKFLLTVLTKVREDERKTVMIEILEFARDTGYDVGPVLKELKDKIKRI